MNRITAKAILGELLEAYDECEHGDYFYDNGDVVCDAVECILEEPRWISVEERLPEEAERVLVRLSGDKPPIGEPRMDTDRVADGMWARWNELVTHWMPLPEPPEVEG